MRQRLTAWYDTAVTYATTTTVAAAAAAVDVVIPWFRYRGRAQSDGLYGGSTASAIPADYYFSERRRMRS